MCEFYEGVCEHCMGEWVRCVCIPVAPVASWNLLSFYFVGKVKVLWVWRQAEQSNLSATFISYHTFNILSVDDLQNM